MSRNPSILEGGAAKTASNVSRLATALQAGGVCYWVPEDEYMLMTKYAPKNGLYLPAEDGVFAYSKMTVNVPGGAPGMDVPTLDENGNPMPSPTDPSYDPTVPTYGPVQVDPTTPATEIPAIPGGPGSSISGINPADGKPYVATVNPDGEIEMRKMPSGIEITKEPNRTTYLVGDRIDYTGIEVMLLDEDGNTFTDDKYPTGIIPFEQLEFPVETAPESTGETGQIYTSGDGVNAVLLNMGDVTGAMSPGYFYTFCYSVYAIGNQSNVRIGIDGSPQLAFATKYYDKALHKMRAYIMLLSERASVVRIYTRELSPKVINYGWWAENTGSGYWAELSTTDEEVANIPESERDPSGTPAEKMSAVTAIIPVNWRSTYNAELFTDTFKIQARSKNESGGDSGEWSGSGGGDFGGGGGGAGTGF